MQNKNSHITFDYILNSLDSESDRSRVFEEIKNSELIGDDAKGVKLFLENNDYNYLLLKEFLTPSNDEFDKILLNNTPTKVSNSWLKYAAILIPLIGLSYLFFAIKMDNSSNLYAEYYEKEIGLPVTMGITDNILFAESMNAFKAEEFQESLIGFNELLREDINNDTLLYFSGCSNMELGKFEIAIKQFGSIQGNSEFKDKSDYRLCLVFIQMNELPLAKTILTGISNDRDHQYNANAILLLKDIELTDF